MGKIRKLIFISSMLACSSGMAEAAKNTVTVGLSSAFSGATGFQGEDAKRGVELAMKDIASAGSPVNYKLVISDDECTPAGGATSFRNLIEAQNVDVIIGSGCSGSTLGGMTALLDGEGVSALTYGATSPKITQSGNPYMWRMNLNDDTIAKEFSKFIASEGVKNLNVLGVNSDFGRGAAEAYAKTLPKDGVKMNGSDFFTSGTSDLRNVLAKIGQQKPDAILFFGEPPDCALLMRQIREMNIHVKIFSRGACYTDEALKLMGDPKIGDGLTEAAYWVRTSDQKMVEEYRKQYGTYPAYNAALAYYAMLTINEAVKAGSPDKDGITKGLGAMNAKLDIGPVKFDKQHQAYPNLFMVHIVDGKSQVIKTISTHG